ncbi:hypothetical protein [Serinicoccus sp. CNJ-927]|uniref:hypothetical protein n=1 Tax=Serinicoccus sp. CNJ-927 TaxID=1904970 RepID=UPI00117A7EE3|nr:hypothetical protein [Serinicoccus sp. CNJ-927]
MPSATDQKAVPWRIYLLIDPTTEPTNHALGTIFYVGLREKLPEPVDLSEAVQWQSLPDKEWQARDHLKRLTTEGVRVVVEVIPEQDWSQSRGWALGRTLGSICAVLDPAPLNIAHRSIRWPASLARTVETARVVPLPENGAILRLHKGETHVAELPLLDADSLFEEAVEVVEGKTSPRTIGNRLREGGPLPLVLTADGRTGRGVLPGGFVLGVWMVSSVEPLSEERTRWRVIRGGDAEREGALRRRYLHQLVDLRDSRALKLRKA